MLFRSVIIHSFHLIPYLFEYSVGVSESRKEQFLGKLLDRLGKDRGFHGRVDLLPKWMEKLETWSQINGPFKFKQSIKDSIIRTSLELKKLLAVIKTANAAN